MSSYQYRDPNVKDDKNPLHLHVVDRCLRRIGDKTIPDIDLPQSRCCGFFVSFIDKKHVLA